MSVILKENDWAKKMIDDHSLGKKPMETMRRVARYYLDQGYSANEVRRKMDEFCLICDPDISIPKWSDRLDQALKRAIKYPAIDIDGVPIYEKELETIGSLNSKMSKKLAFTLLCLAKYWKLIRPDADYWVRNKDSEIMAMANVRTSLKRQWMLYSDLSDVGMIRPSHKIDSTNIQVCFVESSGEEKMFISDFRNLGYRYLMYYGESFYECDECGLVTKYNDPKNKRKQKYCPDCASKIATKQRVESVSRYKDRVFV